MTIDAIDVEILNVLKMAGKPVWKHKIYQLLVEENPIQLAPAVSVQTVGRRVNKLNSERYVKSSIINPKRLNRDLIIAYSLTDKGREQLATESKELLINQVHQYLITGDIDNRIDRAGIIQLLANWCDHIEENREHFEQFDREKLLLLLTRFYLEQHSEELFSAEIEEELRRAVPETTAESVSETPDEDR